MRVAYQHIARVPWAILLGLGLSLLSGIPPAQAADREGLEKRLADAQATIAALEKVAARLDAEVGLLKKQVESLRTPDSAERDTESDVPAVPLAQVIAVREAAQRIWQDRKLTDVQRTGKLREHYRKNGVQMLRATGTVTNVAHRDRRVVVTISASNLQIQATVLPVHSQAAQKLSRGQGVTVVGHATSIARGHPWNVRIEDAELLGQAADKPSGKE